MQYTASTSQPPERRRLRKTQKDAIFVAFCLLPAFLCLAIVVFFPIAKAAWISLFDYKFTNVNPPVWNNFENYIDLFASGDWLVFLKNTFIYIFFTVTIQFMLAIIVALLLNSNIKGRNAMRSLLFMPWTIPSVVTALLWVWLLQPQYGVLNYIFYHLGLISNENQLWVQDPQLAMASVIIAALWRQTPYMMVMLLAGLQAVPSDLLEAGKMDGANRFQLFRHILLPSIRPVIDSAILVSVITNSQMFAIIYNMTAGGPMNRTTTFSIAAYQKSFTAFDFGGGAAIGVVWLLILGTVTWMYKRYAERNVADQ
ncbi:carbohydrate ABC transporter permease [Paenibacillus sp. GCM10027626]|uniref:carbohydrate ABC transporter permease n=1 Tax=Paenibacillus sp. GCM10027626 TaxID=3273411 RepID=UPI00363E8345